MTDKAPDTIWVEPVYNAFGDKYWNEGFEGVGQEYIRTDLHLDLVAAVYGACAEAVSAAQEYHGQKSEYDKEGWAVEVACEEAIEAVRALTPTDAKAARDARDAEVRREALTGAHQLLAEMWASTTQDHMDAILALIEKERTEG